MSKKLKKLIKNKTLLIGIIIGLASGTSGVALAANVLYSSDVTYDNTESGLSATTVQAALDELYEQASSCPICDSNGVCTVTCPSGEYYISTSTGYRCSISRNTINKLGATVVTTGDGLYADSVTSGRYIYRGITVNNYITFNDETWRIISVESDGTLKIIKNEQLSSTQAWDTTSNRNKSTSTYCLNASAYGCNVWAATTNLVGSPSEYTQYYTLGNISDYSDKYTGTVVSDAILNTYLNGTYYNSLTSTAQSQVVTGTFNVSTPGDQNDTEALEVDAEQEKQYQWKGKVALMNVTELLRASTSSGCTSLSVGCNNQSSSTCSSNNWLWPTFNTSIYE